MKDGNIIRKYGYKITILLLLLCSVLIFLSAKRFKKSKIKSPLKHKLVKKIKLRKAGGVWPKQVRITPDGKYAVCPNMVSKNISIIATSNYKVITNIKSPAKMPVELCFSDDSKTAYVQCLDPGITLKIDLEKFKIVNTSSYTGVWPKIIEFTPDRKELWITDWLGHCVFILDAKNLKLKKKIKTARTPRGLGFRTDKPYAYVANFYEKNPKKGKIQIIDRKKYRVIKTYKNLGGAPRHVTVSSDNKYIYVSNMWKHKIHVIDGKSNKIIYNLKTGSRPKTTDLTSNNRFLYCANFHAANKKGSISVFDLKTKKKIDTLKAGIATTGLDVSPDDKYVWVTNMNESTVMVYKIIKK